MSCARRSPVAPNADLVEKLTRLIIPDEWARDMHFFSAKRFRDFLRTKAPRKTVLISKLDDGYSRLGLGWRARSREQGPRILGVDECCTYLNSVVDSIWREMERMLKTLNRKETLLALLSNHEGIETESNQWFTTARSVLSFHQDKEATTQKAVEQIARFNAGSLAAGSFRCTSRLSRSTMES
jgi:hypothetical protein